eukprot:557385-Alexandrium_andersonii.AAC.1
MLEECGLAAQPPTAASRKTHADLDASAARPHADPGIRPVGRSAPLARAISEVSWPAAQLNQ